MIDFFLGKDEDALVSFRRLKEESPQSNFANFFMAQMLVKHNRHQEALALLDELLERTPDFVEALYLRAQALRGLYRNFDAVQCLRKALELSPGDAKIRMELEMLVEVPAPWADAPETGRGWPMNLVFLGPPGDRKRNGSPEACRAELDSTCFHRRPVSKSCRRAE